MAKIIDSFNCLSPDGFPVSKLISGFKPAPPEKMPVPLEENPYYTLYHQPDITKPYLVVVDLERVLLNYVSKSKINELSKQSDFSWFEPETSPDQLVIFRPDINEYLAQLANTQNVVIASVSRTQEDSKITDEVVKKLMDKIPILKNKLCAVFRGFFTEDDYDHGIQDKPGFILHGSDILIKSPRKIKQQFGWPKDVVLLDDNELTQKLARQDGVIIPEFEPFDHPFPPSRLPEIA